MRSVIVRIIALGAGCILALLLVEVLLRVLQLSPAQAVGSVNEADFLRYPGLLTPGQELIDRDKPALPYHVRVNNLGYRGADLSVEKRPAEFRVLAVGDSFTYGDFVDDAETLPARLEAGLRARCGDASVINAGIGGTTLLTHTAMVQRARQLDPDFVVLTFSENDISDLAAPMWNSLAENRRRKSRFPFRYVYPILRHTAVWNFALKTRATMVANAQARTIAGGAVNGEDPSAESLAEQRRTEQRRALRNEYAQRLGDLSRSLDEAGLPLLFVLYPSHHSVLAPGARERMIWAEETARSLGITTISLIDALESSHEAMDVLYLLPEDGHPSPLGYRLAADELLRRFDWAAASGGACTR